MASLKQIFSVLLIALTFQKHHGKHLWVIIYHVRVWTPQCRISGGLGSLSDYKGSCPRSPASWVLLHGKEVLHLGKAEQRLQRELVLGPGATSPLLLPAPDRPRAPSARPSLSWGGKRAFPPQGGGMAEQKAQLVAQRGGVMHDFLNTRLLACVLKGIGKRQFKDKNKL